MRITLGTGRSVYRDFEVCICGYETIVDKTAGQKLTVVYTAVSPTKATNINRDSGLTISNMYTITFDPA